MALTYNKGTAQSLRREDHEEIGSLLQFLLAPGVGPLTSEDVIERVLLENRDDTLRLGGLLGPQTMRVSGMAETEYCLGQAFSVTSSTE